MRGNIKVIFDRTFINLWHSDKTTQEIAEIYGVKYPAINGVGRRHGLPPRQICRGTPPQDIERRTRREGQKQAPPREIHATKDFDAGRDGALVATRGKYRALCDLADKWGLPVAKVQARWHLVRS